MERITAHAIQIRIKQLASILDSDYKDKDLVLVGVLNGSFVFMADVVRSLTIDPEVDFIKAHSYQGTKSSGVVTTVSQLTVNITGRHVVVVEDIIDSGDTIAHVTNIIEQHNPQSIQTLCLLYRNTVKEMFKKKPKYICFSVGKGFFVGYGLDINGKRRGLRDLQVT
jgi:hypoxanthine phosphoribosyltransferase|tara:strand:- start:36 stop:536 length:501 start_codon:yes stop_codon:yes gene_type:complete